MTEPEVWQQLEDAFRNREWTRAAILADALQECGQEVLADTVRWRAGKTDSLYCRWNGDFWSLELPKTFTGYDNPITQWYTLADGIREIHKYRLKQLAYFST